MRRDTVGKRPRAYQSRKPGVPKLSNLGPSRQMVRPRLGLALQAELSVRRLPQAVSCKGTARAPGAIATRPLRGGPWAFGSPRRSSGNPVLTWRSHGSCRHDWPAACRSALALLELFSQLSQRAINASVDGGGRLT